MFALKLKDIKIGNKIIKPNVDYLVSEFTKEELEQILVGKVVRFWTRDCQIMPDFDITAPVNSISYFNNGEIAINIMRKQYTSGGQTLQLSSRMHKLKFRIMSN